MTDNSLPGPMSMVKVDGSKIKRLREEQGLTQLYLATAVHVTTDTISRWENKRYPSIKKENGIKLAEALNVSLEDLLEKDDTREPDLLTSVPSQTDATTPRNTLISPRKIWLLLSLFLTLLALGITFIWYFFYSSPDFTITAERNAPDHCIAGEPFPILIKVSGVPEDKATSVIIRENLPANATILKISPELAGGSLKKDMIKWLKKINTSTTFAYVISVAGEESEKITFYGTAAISGDSGSPPPIVGSSITTLSQYHWADIDKDNTISDSEILAVHDRYNEVEDIDIDIDIIEEIWLGSGYKWNETRKIIEIIK